VPIINFQFQKTMSKIKVLVIAGPTTSGKSDLAVAIAEQFGGVVINGDSMQLYDGLNIISAAPDKLLRKKVPHKLFGVRDPASPCSAGQWVELVQKEILNAQSSNLLPIIVGGTGMYLKALISGLVKLPPISEKIRRTLRNRLKVEGPAALHAELSQIDPVSANKLAVSDGQRVLRGLEVYLMTGKTLGQWQMDKTGQNTTEGFTFKSLLISPPRKLLYQNCNSRFEKMIKCGVIEEVRALSKKNLSPNLPAMKALGVPEIILYLSGNLTLEETISRAQIATRRYVKRQETWFKHQFIADFVLKTEYNFNLNPKIFPFISKFLLT
jgi:tRNA dimethylallyltransferase